MSTGSQFPPPTSPRGVGDRSASGGAVTEAVGEMVRTSPALSGCALVLLLLGLVSLLLPCAADDLLVKALDGWQGQIEARLPQDLREEERTTLAWAFEDAAHAIRSGDHDADALSRVRRRAESGGRLDRAAVATLTADLRAVAGRPSTSEP